MGYKISAVYCRNFIRAYNGKKYFLISIIDSGFLLHWNWFFPFGLLRHKISFSRCLMCLIYLSFLRLWIHQLGRRMFLLRLVCVSYLHCKAFLFSVKCLWCTKIITTNGKFGEICDVQINLQYWINKNKNV